jgi:hypothetical protein
MLGRQAGPTGPAHAGFSTHGAVLADGILLPMVRFLTGLPVRDPKPRPAAGDVGDHAWWACVIARIGCGCRILGDRAGGVGLGTVRGAPGGCLLPGGRALQRPGLLATQRGGRRLSSSAHHSKTPRRPANNISRRSLLDRRRPTAPPAHGPSPTHRNSRRARYIRPSGRPGRGL